MVEDERGTLLGTGSRDNIAKKTVLEWMPTQMLLSSASMADACEIGDSMRIQKED